MPFEVIEHTADTGIRVWAPDIPTLFSEAARGMFSLLTDLDHVTPTRTRSIKIDGIDQTDLLVNTLRELLYLFNAEDLIVKALDMEQVGASEAIGTIHCDPVDPEKHEIHLDIKAVTYAGGDIRKKPEGFEITVIFDI